MNRRYVSVAQRTRLIGARRMNVGMRRVLLNGGLWQANDLISALGRVVNRYGNTCVWFKALSWGATALHANDAHRARNPRGKEQPARPDANPARR